MNQGPVDPPATVLAVPHVQSAAPVAADPPRRLDPRVVWVWRGTMSIWALFCLAVSLVAVLFAGIAPLWTVPVALLGATLTWMVPAARYRHWSYTVGDLDVRVSHGWLWRRVSLVLHARIQHVDTHQGPLERAAGLATVVMYTAGSIGAVVAIPGLARGDAEALRDRLAALSGADDAV